MKRTLKITEHALQVSVIQWWALICRRYGLPEFALYAIPNGGARHVAVAKKLKAEGVRAGIPDLALDVARGGYHGLRLELKAGKNKPSAAQEEVMDFLRRQQYAVRVCWTYNDAVAAIDRYLGGINTVSEWK